MSVKKEPSGRRSVQVEVEVPGTTQPATERRSAEAQSRGLIVKFTPEHQRLVGTVRRSLQKRLPSAHEIVYEYRDCFVISFAPSEHGYEGVLVIRGSAKGVDLYFNRGQGLPASLEIAAGVRQKLARFIHVEGASTLARPAVKRLIDEAIARNDVPFARTWGAGRWSGCVRHRSVGGVAPTNMRLHLTRARGRLVRRPIGLQTRPCR